MKRPLCLLAILLTAAVFVFLEIKNPLDSSLYEYSDGEEVTIVGTVEDKEFKKSYDGGLVPVIYIAPTDAKADSEMVQCYIKEQDDAVGESSIAPSVAAISVTGERSTASSAADFSVMGERSTASFAADFPVMGYRSTASSAVGLPSIGEYVEIHGRVRNFLSPTNPGEFDSRLYYQTLKISYRLSDCNITKRGGSKSPYKESLFRLRLFLEGALDIVLNEDDSGVMKAMLLGDKAFMDAETRDLYMAGGIMHILAVSGLHISIIGMGIYELLRRLMDRAADFISRIRLRSGKVETAAAGKGRYRKKQEQGSKKIPMALIYRSVPVLISVLFMYSYGVMCGMSSSSFRAICMFVLRIMAPLFGRTYDLLSALAFSEMLLLLDQPLYLYNSGFLFSFGAVIGASVIAPHLHITVLERFLADRGLIPPSEAAADDPFRMRFVDDKITMLQKIIGALLSGLTSGAGIALATLPVYSLYYYTYPVHSIFLNLVVIPLMGILMVAGIGTMVAGGVISAVAGGGIFPSSATAIATSSLLLQDRGVLGRASAASFGTSAIQVGSALSERGMAAEEAIHLLGLPVHLILWLYRALCSSALITRNMTWFLGHSDRWQVLAYLMLMGAFVFFSVGFRNRDEEADSQRGEGSKHPETKDIGCSEIKRGSGIASDCGTEPAYFKSINVMPGSAVFYGERSDFRLLRIVILLVAVFILTFHIKPQMEINMIDVGQGDGIVISGGNSNIMIDGGSTSKKNVGRYQIIPFLKYKGIGRLRAIILTHEDEDHLSGIMDVLDDMEKGGIWVDELILPEVDASSRGNNYQKLAGRANDLGIPISYINTGERFNVGKAEFTCLNPVLNMKTDGANEYSTVLFMKYGRFTALFTGDVEGEGQEDIRDIIAANPDGYGNLSLLKVAHHGSRYTTDEEFLEMITPRVALVSCGRNNTYGHPHEEVLERLERVGARVYRTDLGGAITVEVLDAGDTLKVEEYLDDK